MNRGIVKIRKINWDRKNKVAAVVATLAMLAAGGGTAYALWSAPISGSSDVVNAADALPVVVTQTGRDGDLRPGSQVTLSGTIYNPNAEAVNIGILGAEVTKVTGAKSEFLNTMTYFIVGAPVKHASVVPAMSSIPWTGLVLKYADLASLPSGDVDKGATITIKYKFYPRTN